MKTPQPPPKVIFSDRPLLADDPVEKHYLKAFVQHAGWQGHYLQPGLNVLDMTESNWYPVKVESLGLEVSIDEVVRSEATVRAVIQQRFGHSDPSQAEDLAQRIDAVLLALRELRTFVVEMGTSACVPLRTLDDDSIEVVTPIDVLIAPEEDGFQASFLDGKLHAYGDSREEAIENIGAVILETYERLKAFPDERLGKSMLRTKRLLSRHLRETKR